MVAALVLFLLSLPWLLAFASVVATALHTAEELVEEGSPIWRYLGLPVADAVGLGGLLAFAGLQVVLAWVGYVDGCRLALLALVVIRLGDCVVSHWMPWLFGRRPNPGLATTPLYVIDAVAAGLVWSGGLY